MTEVTSNNSWKYTCNNSKPFECPICNERFLVQSNYCPNCGEKLQSIEDVESLREARQEMYCLDDCDSVEYRKRIGG